MKIMDVLYRSARTPSVNFQELWEVVELCVVTIPPNKRDEKGRNLRKRKFKNTQME